MFARKPFTYVITNNRSQSIRYPKIQNLINDETRTAITKRIEIKVIKKLGSLLTSKNLEIH